MSVDEGERNITFNELETIKPDISLADRNIIRGGRVAVLSDNRLELPVLYFSLLRYGAAFCTINVEVNGANLREMLARINPELILYHQDLTWSTARF